MLQTGISWGFHRPMSTHLTRIGTVHRREEHRAAERDRPQVDVEQVRAGRDPLVALHRDGHGEGGVAEEEQQLQRPAEDVLTSAGGLGGSMRATGAAGAAGCEAGVGLAAVLGPARAAARLADRRVLVDVLHRHRRQVGALAHPRAEAGHQHRVGTEVVEEVVVDRHVLGAHDAGQHLRELPLAGGRSGRLASRTRGRDVAGQGGCKAADRRVLVDVLHRHRRQVRALAHPRAEPGHQHRVGTQVVEEVVCRPTRARCPRCRPAPPRTAARMRPKWSDRQPDPRSRRRRPGRLQGSGSSGAGRRPASTPTAGPRACAPARRTGPSASSRHPRSSKKLLSTDTCSVPTMPASTSANCPLAGGRSCRIAQPDQRSGRWEGFPSGGPLQSGSGLCSASSGSLNDAPAVNDRASLAALRTVLHRDSLRTFVGYSPVVSGRAAPPRSGRHRAQSPPAHGCRSGSVRPVIAAWLASRSTYAFLRTTSTSKVFAVSSASTSTTTPSVACWASSAAFTQLSMKARVGATPPDRR